MKKVNQATEEIYRLYAAGYLEAERKLTGRASIAANWLIRAGLYPDQQAPQGAGLQLFRANWFNEAGNGIHFESWMKKAYHDKGEVPFVLHVEAGKARAGFSRNDFSRLFLERCGEQLAAQGYQLNPAYAMEPVKCVRAMSVASFAEVVEQEFLVLSEFGDAIEQLIAELRSDSKAA